MKTYWIPKQSSGSVLSDGSGIEILKAYGVHRISNPIMADVLVGVTARQIIKLRKLMPWKRSLLWTNEPAYSTMGLNYLETKGWPRRALRVMDVYTGGVFRHNLHFLGSYHYIVGINLGINLDSLPSIPSFEEFRSRKKQALAVFTRKPGPNTILCPRLGNIDLNDSRQSLALNLHSAGCGSIVGKGWPEGVAIDNSGFGNYSSTEEWWHSKLRTLRNYQFNICSENTAFPHYCTEKIWHSIASGCVPIYHAKNTKILETFPEDAFIDASRLSSSDELVQLIQNMSTENAYGILIKAHKAMCVATAKIAPTETRLTEIMMPIINQFQLID